MDGFPISMEQLRPEYKWLIFLIDNDLHRLWFAKQTAHNYAII